MSVFRVHTTKLAGVMLFFAFWLTALFPFVLQEFAYPAYEVLYTPLSLLSDVLLLFAGVCLLRKRSDIILVVSFLLISGISTLYFNHLSVVFLINGARYYFGLLFLIPVFRYFFETPDRRRNFIHKMDSALYIFLWIQVPCMVFQCILYGAYDQVGGSLGWMMSGLISSLIYMISFYLMLRRWDRGKSYISNLKKNYVLIFLLFPSFLNETKISFLFLILYFFFLIPMDRRFIMRLLVAAPLVLLLLTGALWAYSTIVDESVAGDIFDLDYIDYYINGNESSLDLVERLVDRDLDDIESDDIYRGLKFAAISWITDSHPHAKWIGFGIGQFKGGKVMDKTGFAKDYNWLVRGTTPMGLIWFTELGWIGIAWIVYLMIYLLRLYKKYSRNYQLQIFLILTFLIEAFYTSAFLSVPFSIIFIYLSFVSSRWKELEDEKDYFKTHTYPIDLYGENK